MDQKRKVLILSASRQQEQLLNQIFPRSLYEPIKWTSSLDETRQILSRQSYDMVLLSAAGGHTSMIEAAGQIASRFGIGVLLLVKPEHYDQACYQLGDKMVFIVTTPVSRTTLTQAVDMLEKVSFHIRIMEQKLKKEKQKLQDAKLVFHCKLMLMQDYKWDEEKAHRFIEKTAMDHSLSSSAVAKILLDKARSRKQLT